MLQKNAQGKSEGRAPKAKSQEELNVLLETQIAKYKKQERLTRLVYMFGVAYKHERKFIERYLAIHDADTKGLENKNLEKQATIMNCLNDALEDPSICFKDQYYELHRWSAMMTLEEINIKGSDVKIPAYTLNPDQPFSGKDISRDHPLRAIENLCAIVKKDIIAFSSKGAPSGAGYDGDYLRYYPKFNLHSVIGFTLFEEEFQTQNHSVEDIMSIQERTQQTSAEKKSEIKTMLKGNKNTTSVGQGETGASSSLEMELAKIGRTEESALYFRTLQETYNMAHAMGDMEEAQKCYQQIKDFKESMAMERVAKEGKKQDKGGVVITSTPSATTHIDQQPSSTKSNSESESDDESTSNDSN